MKPMDIWVTFVLLGVIGLVVNDKVLWGVGIAGVIFGFVSFVEYVKKKNNGWWMQWPK